MFTHRFILPGEPLEDAFAVRVPVFVEEQHFTLELEIDDIDPTAHHVVIYCEDRPVATGRLFPHDKTPNLFVIGRVAVLKSYRGHKLGAAIIGHLEELARQLGATATTLGAQCQAAGFYQKLGYVSYGDIYLDEHCEHTHMKKQLASSC